jgi:predicted DNA binding CopG/RHH family protein
MKNAAKATTADLDRYEQKIERALSRGEYTRADDADSAIKLFKDAAKNYRILQKSKPITIRVNQEDLLKVKSKAKKSRIPYQTLLSALIHHFAEGRTRINL